MLAHLPNVQLTIVIGQYAMAYHLPVERSGPTGAVLNWRQYWPHVIPLPHPSPRNQMWLKRNPWFEAGLIPMLRQRVRVLLSDAGADSALS